MYQGNNMTNSFYMFINVFLFITKFSWKKTSYYVDDYIRDFKKEYTAFMIKFRQMNHDDNDDVVNVGEQSNTTEPNKILDDAEPEIDNDYSIDNLKED